MGEDWKLEIKKVSNGYILKGRNSETEILMEKVIEESNIDLPELNAMQNLLWEIMEYFAIFNSKHNPYHLNVKIEKNPAKE